MNLEDPSNAAARPGNCPGADCQAALVLVESLIHVLLERSLLTVHDAVSAVQTAIDVTSAKTVETDELTLANATALDPLFRILDSLEVDVHPSSRRAREGRYPPLHSVD